MRSSRDMLLVSTRHTTDSACVHTNVSAVKLPFPLTPQFKQMLQAGVGTRDLDVRWVSSLSWYFLTLFGLQPVYNFILGSNNAANPMGGADDPDKIFNAEAENLEVIDHWCVLDGVEDRLLAKFAAELA
jgi:hypothetical protein